MKQLATLIVGLTLLLGALTTAHVLLNPPKESPSRTDALFRDEDVAAAEEWRCADCGHVGFKLVITQAEVYYCCRECRSLAKD